MGSVAELTKDNFESTIKEGLTLIDFWAEWCGPCKMIAPIVDEIANQYEGKATIAKVNVDDESELAAKFNVSSIPTLVLLKNGTETNRFIGAKASLKTELAAAIDAAS